MSEHPIDSPGAAPDDAVGMQPAQDSHALAAALAALAVDRTRRPLLVALDFDGVLAPLVDDPDTSAALPAAIRAIARLSAVPEVRCALVSGRSLGDLFARAGADLPTGTILVGSHGAERGQVGADGLDEEGLALDTTTATTLARLTSAVTAQTKDLEGVWIQHKPAAVVVHTRLAGREAAGAATQIALDLGAAHGAGVLAGKDVVELSVLTADKGEALERLREQTGAATVLYAGDDRTDEDAFAVLDGADLTIKVGPGPSLARLRSSGPAQLADQLEEFARAAV